jgi:hypothetical protein
MNAQTINHRGTAINKLQFSEVEDLLENKGINVNEAFNLLADEKEFIYVSNGFITGLKADEKGENEWHHYFIKDVDGTFTAEKFKF